MSKDNIIPVVVIILYVLFIGWYYSTYIYPQSNTNDFPKEYYDLHKFYTGRYV